MRLLLLCLLATSASAAELPPPGRHPYWMAWVKPAYCACVPPTGLLNQILDPQWRTIGLDVAAGWRHQAAFDGKMTLWETDF